MSRRTSAPRLLPIFLFFLFATAFSDAAKLVTDGTRWDTHELHFEGPMLSETAKPNPFTDYRMDVRFRHAASGVVFVVPGFFAADGRAADTSASEGRVWIARFTPSRTGSWAWSVRFITGSFAATTGKGKAVGFNGAKGAFTVKESAAKWPDLRSMGRLQYVGTRYFRFANGRTFLKLGTNTPENLLGYSEFDNPKLPARHDFASHLKDWRRGDPTWKNGRGKAIIGAINYLHAQKVNSLFSLLMTVRGDSHGDVFPWVKPEEVYRFDVSKLEQWYVVFKYASSKGLTLNLSFLETENEALFEYLAGKDVKADFAVTRKLFYREMVARFSAHLGFTMTIGEENGWDEYVSASGHAGNEWGKGNTPGQRAAFSNYIRSIDPYDSPILVHTFPPEKKKVYYPLFTYTNARVESASLQMGRMKSTNFETLFWLDYSAKQGRQWVVTGDEFGGGDLEVGGVPLAKWKDQTKDNYRAQWAWANALAGGAGIELYVAVADQSLDDFRQLDWAWAEFSRVRSLFERHAIPYWAMNSHNELIGATVSEKIGNGHAWTYCLAKPGEVYVAYWGGSMKDYTLNLAAYPATMKFQVRWYSPRRHESNDLLTGNVRTVSGGRSRSFLGNPPAAKLGQDWVAVVSRSFPLTNKKTLSLLTVSPRDLIPGSMTLGNRESWS